MSGRMMARHCPKGHTVHAPLSMASVWCLRCGKTFVPESVRVEAAVLSEQMLKPSPFLRVVVEALK